jgi:hypothetical protein
MMILVYWFRDFQFKKYPKTSCSAGILPANNTRTGKIPLDSEALLQAVHFFRGVLLFFLFTSTQSMLKHNQQPLASRRYLSLICPQNLSPFRD